MVINLVKVLKIFELFIFLNLACLALRSSFSQEEILNDPVCKVQCAFAFRVEKSRAQQQGTMFGFSQ